MCCISCLCFEWIIESVVKLLAASMVDVKENINDNLLALDHNRDLVAVQDAVSVLRKIMTSSLRNFFKRSYLRMESVVTLDPTKLQKYGSYSFEQSVWSNHYPRQGFQGHSTIAQICDGWLQYICIFSYVKPDLAKQIPW